jgi:hypothetical protein
MSNLTDPLFGNDAERRKLGLQIAQEITAAVVRTTLAEISQSGEALRIKGSVEVDLTIEPEKQTP